MTAKDLRQIVARQLRVLAYVDEQLGPRVFVGLDDINTLLPDRAPPEMQKRGQTVPPPEDVRDQIRTVLREQRLNEAIGKVDRGAAPQGEHPELFRPAQRTAPPVVKKIAPPPPGKKKP